MTPFSQLDDTAQRTLVLRVAKACGPKTLEDMRNDPPTIAGLDERIQENISDSLFSVLWAIWMLPTWLDDARELLRMWRLRRAVRDQGHLFLGGEDAECHHLVLVSDIRRLLSNPPKPYRGKLRDIRKQLEQASRYWNDLNVKLVDLEVSLRNQTEESQLLQMQNQISAAVSQAETPAEIGLLQDRLRTLEEHLEAYRETAAAIDALSGQQSQCTEQLMLLRTRLTLLFTKENSGQPSNSPQIASEVDELNLRLASIHTESQELQHIRS